MANSYFSFKQFTVHQDLCAMKVGIDGVLLGVWVSTGIAKRILDIGTGTGLIALMLAQRCTCIIDSIDIHPNAIIQAKENIRLSPWADRINAEEISLQDYAATTTLRYDLIVSNPPYFVNSLKAPDEDRAIARHTDSLTHEELILNAIKLLTPIGKICIILPVFEAAGCKKYALSKGLFCTREVKVIPKPNAEVKRILMEFGFQDNQNQVSELVVESTTRHRYSEEFILLAKDYYLRF